MHVTYAGPTSLDLCFTVKSLSCRGRSCSWVCNTFSVILFLCFCTCSYLVTLLVSIFWIAFCQVCLTQAFTVFLLLTSWGQGLSSLKFLWAEGRGRGEHVASGPGQVWFINSFSKATVLPRVNQWKPEFSGVLFDSSMQPTELFGRLICTCDSLPRLDWNFCYGLLSCSSVSESSPLSAAHCQILGLSASWVFNTLSLLRS